MYRSSRTADSCCRTSTTKRGISSTRAQSRWRSAGAQPLAEDADRLQVSKLAPDSCPGNGHCSELCKAPEEPLARGATDKSAGAAAVQAAAKSTGSYRGAAKDLWAMSALGYTEPPKPQHPGPEPVACDESRITGSSEVLVARRYRVLAGFRRTC